MEESPILRPPEVKSNAVPVVLRILLRNCFSIANFSTRTPYRGKSVYPEKKVVRRKGRRDPGVDADVRPKRCTREKEANLDDEEPWDQVATREIAETSDFRDYRFGFSLGIVCPRYFAEKTFNFSSSRSFTIKFNYLYSANQKMYLNKSLSALTILYMYIHISKKYIYIWYQIYVYCLLNY